ncbi:MAG: iron ABC transporter permease [Nitrospira sp.]|nr:iron ABC transporter permease [Nitrospira sp.]
MPGMSDGQAASMSSVTVQSKEARTSGFPEGLTEFDWITAGAVATVRRRRLVLTGIVVAAAIVVIVSTAFGAAHLGGGEVLRAWWRLVTIGRLDEAGGPAGVILFQVRLPRVLMGFLIGCTLAGVGTTLQALLRNPLADPYVLGISSGAALGITLATLLAGSSLLVQASVAPVWGVAGGLIALVVIYLMAQSRGRLPVHGLLLAGVVLNAVLTAFMMFITSIMDPVRSAGLIAWLMGSVIVREWGGLLGIAAYVAIGTAWLWSQAPVLNLLTQGEETARSLGIDVEQAKKRLYVVTALLVGAVVSVSGMIGFVGMVVPHMVRMALGADHRLLLPAAALVGGMFLVISDTVARTILAPSEIPVGVVTALVGGPIFLYFLLAQKSRMV